jgi:RNA polymerase sigma-70 factor (ECF subfamily)
MDKAEEDAKKFMSLLVPNQRQIYAFILCLTANRTEADDILQDTLAEMWSKFNDYQDGTNFTAWAVTIARYKVMHSIDKNKSYRFHFEPRLLELLQQEIVSRQTERHEKDKIEALKECVQKLHQKEKSMLKMRYEDNLTFEGIAGRVGVSVPAVYKALSRVHTRLARCILVTLRNWDIV